MSDCGTESDEESSSDKAALSLSSAEHDFFNPVRRAQRVASPDRLSRSFDATHAHKQTQDCRPNPSVAAEISDRTANVSLEELYGLGLTSYPHQTVIEVEMKASLLSLLSIDAFEYMLAKPATRKAFRDWLIHQGGADKLDRWTEESRINQLHIEAQQGAQQLLERYHDSDGKNSAKPSQIGKVESLNKHAITEIINLAHSSQVLVASRQHLLQSLYNETFKRFITSKLLEITKMKLRSGVDENTCKGLGDSFVVSNPHLRDNPVVMVSPSFTATTGHDREAIIGKNCRFLQGPGTSPQSIQRLRVALQKGLPSVELLLNYKADGTPFYCLLSILPLFDENGVLCYYIGGQINVTDEMRNNQLMALISQSNNAPGEITSEDFQTPTSPTASYADSKQMATNNPLLLERSAGSVDSHQNSSIDRTRSKLPRYISFDWLNFKNRHQKKIQEVEFIKPDHRCEFNGPNLSGSLSAFQSTYSRLILFNQATRSIIFITPEALNFLGYPTKTMEETYSSVLLHHDFFDLFDNCKTTRKTPLSKKVLKKIISRKSSASFECELSWTYPLDDNNSRISSKQTKKLQVLGTSVIHLTPLIDTVGQCASYVAVLG